MKLVIDRVEGEHVIAELPDGQTVALPRLLFPAAAEGDCYTIQKGSAETGNRRRLIEAKMERLFRD